MDNKKIENAIIDYFKIINQLAYKDIKIKLDKKTGVCVIIINTESQRDMFPYVTLKNGRTPAANYNVEMRGMFPYDFVINFEYQINTDERVYD